ncbi:arsenic resistance N-acetyltransferase ArsN2 [Halosolutus gelatinilyticus]|uniref:arsenic resistance N-acetyltransferase ArsN2 n=1 Tax=Halosolutus gelatinilyticus TaxID=2931975 RepID=UPI001FF40555|nr:arsenic resistance N-acetyltransferase ArsN2 [Halosolutus gelatinilyticus]
MADAPISLTRADDGRGLSYLESLLEENDLPSRDVRSKPECFYVGYADEDPIGVGGIERDGSDGLLRSVVVERSVRGTGYGTALCDALEAEARGDGVEALYLLTMTAVEFFVARSYREIDRDDAPEAIRETTEFAELCPSTATCMRKSL